MKIKGLADQGLDQQPPQPQSQSQRQQQQNQQNQDSQSFKSEEDDDSENEDPNPALDPIIHSTATRLIHQSSLQEPLKVPIPPSSQFRRSDSNSRYAQ